jgi:hypothetical protein
MIAHAGIEEGSRGQGLGTEAYRRIIAALDKKGQVLTSDWDRSPAAEAVWKKLADEGLAHKEPAPEKMMRAADGKMVRVPEGETVYRTGKAKPTPKGDGSTLPGMEGAVSEQQRAAAEHQAETQRQEAQASLSTPVNVDKQAGEMERNSPLFRDSGASGQGGLFGGEGAPEPKGREDYVIGKDSKGRTILDAKGLQPGEIGRVSRESLQLDPRRFQYKLSPDEKGVTDKLQGKNWDENLAGVIQVWKDPEDGEVYVINGHHRFEMAERFNVPNVDVRMIEAPTEQAARAIGAMQNMADGRGTSLDAAKFFRDSGMPPEEVRSLNIDLGREPIAREGLALSTLSDSMFARVIDEDLDPKVGAAIADSAPAPEQQEAMLKYVRDFEKRTGRELTPSMIRTFGERMSRAMTDVKGKPAAQAGLWGEEEMQDHLLGEMAEVTDYVEKYLKKKRSILKSNASETAAHVMGEHGATFDPKKVGESATTESQLLTLFQKESDKVGEVDDEIRKAAEDLHEGDLNPDEVKKQAAKKIRAILEGRHSEIVE